jgi:phosphoglycerate dehydrogenase-like enzyme
VEPLPPGDPLVGLDNVILTPHWLPSARDAARLTMTLISRGMLRAAQGLVPENVVNRRSWTGRVFGTSSPGSPATAFPPP